MKKLGLLVIFLFNTAFLIFTGYMLYEYLGEEKSATPAPPAITEAPKPSAEDENREQLTPREGPAELRIVSIPAEAKVYIDGYHKGNTPGKFLIVSAKGVEQRQITLIKPGYKKWSRNLEVVAGRTKEYRIIFEKE
ncbi:MAG: PEGA domain-containing protein [Elusimicrobiota bacterium]|nr:PEGA domain-containing protein [Elusimicrobiota bacterium]